jgi:hypothetical protein
MSIQMHNFQSVSWNGRDAVRLSNQAIELTALNGGGHIAGLHLLKHGENSSVNMIWESPWETADPGSERATELAKQYGPLGTGKFLAGYTGHSLCLDSFGAPTPEEAAKGLSLHGEAPVMMWKLVSSSGGGSPECRWRIELPVAGLTFERWIRLGEREAVAYIEETVTNTNNKEHEFDWVQHVTFGSPLLNPEESTVEASGLRGRTWPMEYDGGPFLHIDRPFDWPQTPVASTDGTVDLRRPFSVPGKGYIVGLQFDPARPVEYVVAANWKQRLAVGYCFRHADFPWMAIWEENCARQDSPWNGRTRARGMEFGTTPMPLGRSENIRRGRTFGMPSWCTLQAGEKKTARYLIFLTALPEHLHSVASVTLDADAIQLHDGQAEPFLIPAKNCAKFLK